LETLLKLTNLTHLGGFVPVGDIYDMDGVPLDLLEKLSAIKALQFVEIVAESSPRIPNTMELPWYGQESWWLQLRSDEEGTFVGFVPVKLPREVNCEVKGGIYSTSLDYLPMSKLDR